MTCLISIFILLLTPFAHAVELIYEPDTTVPLIYFSIVAPAGSAFDPDGKEGLMNLVGEMVLRGTHRHTRDAFHEQIDAMGAKVIEVTQLDTLQIKGAVLASELPRFWALLSDALKKPAFREKEIQLLKNEIEGSLLEELGDDALVARRHFLRLTLGSHPYGKPPEGTVSSLKKISANDLKNAFMRAFRPQEVILAVGGDLTRHQAEGLKRSLEESLRDYQNETAFLPIPAPTASPHTRLLIVDRPGRSQSRVLIGKIGPSPRTKSYDNFHLANHSFGGPYFSARLLREIRTSRGWSYGAGSITLLSKQPNAWFVTYGPKTSDVLSSVEYVKGLIEEVTQKGQMKADLDFAKNNLVNGAAFLVNTPQKRLESALQEGLLGLPRGHYSRFAERIGKISAPEANHAFSEYLREGAFSWVVLGSAEELKGPLTQTLRLTTDQVIVVPFDSL